jgi:aryl-alcohol dehydrogenase-like predicted oxidoreductase
VQYRQLGRAGVRVSPLAIGTVNFSWLTSEADSFAILDAGRDAGLNFIDTSDNYNAGATEALLGRYFKRNPDARDHFLLATKCYTPPSHWGSPDPRLRNREGLGPNERGLSARRIRSACDASLRRLQTDHIDLYQMHHIDRSVPFDEIWQAMEILVAQGKILYVGSSNFAGWHIARANEAAARRHFYGLVSEQSVYNLSRRTVELEVIPACQGYGMAFLPYSPLGAGLLAGPPPAKRGRAAPAARRTNVQKNYRQPQRLDDFSALCAQLGAPPSQVALAWVLANPAVTAAIVGPRTRTQFADSIAALSLSLDSAARARLDEIFPGPGGPAPEAYAW